jgi:hypothetical protein
MQQCFVCRPRCLPQCIYWHWYFVRTFCPAYRCAPSHTLLKVALKSPSQHPTSSHTTLNQPSIHILSCRRPTTYNLQTSTTTMKLALLPLLGTLHLTTGRPAHAKQLVNVTIFSGKGCTAPYMDQISLTNTDCKSLTGQTLKVVEHDEGLRYNNRTLLLYPCHGLRCPSITKKHQVKARARGMAALRKSLKENTSPRVSKSELHRRLDTPTSQRCVLGYICFPQHSRRA